ncbi:MAG: hypothetical protein QXT64_05410 [Desulfurococcaceae archaeon]
MGMGSAPLNALVKGVYKSHPHEKARKPLSKLGPLEKLVLEYATSVAETFTASDVVVYYRLKEVYGENANKRVHDALQRLMRKGVVSRVKHGVYRLAVDVPTVSQAVDRKEILVGCSRLVVSSVFGGVGFGLGRVHVRGCSSFFEFLVRLRFVKFLVDCAWSVAVWYGAGLFGRGFVRRAVRVALGGARVLGAVVGVHGWRGDRDRSLLPLSYSSVMYFDEHGVDLLVEKRGSVRVSAKVYYVPVEQLPQELCEYCESLLGSPVKLFKRAAARSTRVSSVAR